MMTDYISREAIMQALADYVWNSNHSDLVPAPRWNDAVEIVRDLPAADVAEVRHGHWIEWDDGEGDTFECSVCGEPWTLIAGTPCENNMHYCSNCGAKMDEEDT